MSIVAITAHAGASTLSECLLSWGKVPAPILVENGSRGMLLAYQCALEHAKGYDILAYFHDDLRIDEPWRVQVMREFEDPTVGLVGFGGALEHGTPGLYRDPYDYRQLGRAHFMSNMEDAENHGERFTGSRDVAVLDGFALIVRREILQSSGGWPINTPVGYVGYDYWLCCEARRQGFRIRLVGVSCKHYGGATFVKLGGQRPDAQKQYDDAHRYIYDTCRDVLPFKVAR